MIPIIDELKCTGCGECVKYCGREVYMIDSERKKAKVVNPDNCMTTSHLCVNKCPAEAISFKKYFNKLIINKNNERTTKSRPKIF